jgi:GATA zinc finger domain-containing protein 1
MSNYLQGNYWQIGDIVSVIDEEDGQTYYAQIRGFLQDQYCSKSAVITWLIPAAGDAEGEPTQLHDEFDPKLYVAGIVTHSIHGKL